MVGHCHIVTVCVCWEEEEDEGPNMVAGASRDLVQTCDL